jgi:hypothetical protein
LARLVLGGPGSYDAFRQLCAARLFHAVECFPMGDDMKEKTE